jgi:hypothetical protein
VSPDGKTVIGQDADAVLALRMADGATRSLRHRGWPLAWLGPFHVLVLSTEVQAASPTLVVLDLGTSSQTPVRVPDAVAAPSGMYYVSMLPANARP